ncbi:Alcohol dehydrogenase [Cladophialophora carrionii]|uniref:Alcohol dehydrogenase n=1 Tax=Cladophialophora carrionii TaxID=86049 RepID=A0A1C1CZZ7_9EURO|nr:Alcohol dehydrogenase [Cladophialophora carrionii]
MASSIPTTQTAAWLEKPQPGARFQIRNDIEVPTPGEGDVLVKLEYTGFCHSDVHSAYGETPMSTDIAGHEGVGHVVKLGQNAPGELLNAKVGVRWQYSTCGSCEICDVNPTACPNQVNSGRNTRGTFQRKDRFRPRVLEQAHRLTGTIAEYIIAPAKHVTRIPADLKAEIAAPLLCAGLTLYSAIAKARLRPGDWLVIPGAGGGLGHIGVQIAAKRGYKVIAIDSGESKRALCLKLGASAFLDFKKDAVEDEVKRLTNGFGAHATIVTAGIDAAYEQAFKLIRNYGTLLTCSDTRVGLTVVGSSVGTDAEMQELLQMAVKGEVVPQIAVYPFEEINAVMEKLVRFEIEGRVVLRIPQ